MTNTNIGPRPTNPSEISFEERCFVKVGERTEYSVSRSALFSGPVQFGENRAAAEAYARRAGRPVSETKTSIMKRISWR